MRSHCTQPENIIYATPDADSPVVLTDFSISQAYEDNLMSTQCGTPVRWRSVGCGLRDGHEDACCAPHRPMRHLNCCLGDDMTHK